MDRSISSWWRHLVITRYLPKTWIFFEDFRRYIRGSCAAIPPRRFQLLYRLCSLSMDDGFAPPQEGYEWICHSMYPAKPSEVEIRATIGGPLVKEPYSAALLNVSAMSYGALSDNAILALSRYVPHTFC